ncbi:hypothetical protein Ancab_012949 [Ancistrocladus abbreviatus]
MARKGKQKKKWWDHISSHDKKGNAESGCGLPDAKGGEKDNDVRIINEESPDGPQPNSPLTGGIKSGISLGDERRNNKSGKPQKLDESGMEASQGLQHSVPIKSNLNVDGEDLGLRENGMSNGSPDDSEGLNRKLRSASNGLHTKDVTKHVQFSYVVALESLRAFALSILKTSSDWVERQKPFFINVANNTQRACGCIRMKFLQVYPIVLRWLVHVGNILLLISMVWLDCTVRGVDSFLRLGTTSFLSIIWFSFLSVAAMTGVFKFLLVLAVAALIGIFVGFVVMLSVIAISGAVILWFCGSFLTTSLVIALGGLAFALSYERLALLITTMYSVYCAWMYVGWLGVLLGLNLAFISSDVLVCFLKNNLHQHRSTASEQATGMQGQQHSNNESHHSYAEFGSGHSADRSTGVASTSGADNDVTSEDEVARFAELH